MPDPLSACTIHTIAEPEVVPSEVTTGELDEKPKGIPASATRLNPTWPEPSRTRRNTLSSPLDPAPAAPGAAVGRYTYPPLPPHTAGFDHTPPKGPILATT